jgi:hypothetical protein
MIYAYDYITIIFWEKSYCIIIKKSSVTVTTATGMLLVKEKEPVLVAEPPVGLGGAEPNLESSEPHLAYQDVCISPYSD